MFRPVEGTPHFPTLELQTIEFWQRERIYEQSLEKPAPSGTFVFYEGPPTANGMPHPGHCLTRAMKDLFPRYKTMQGYRCDRKAGWDTHGLPVEVEVCKELGIHSKEQIEAFGIEPFIQKCQQSVWRYMQEWERLTRRIGFWVDLDAAYVTYHQQYVESVWWALKTLFDRGLLYQGHKIVWWWAQGGTALSSGEVGQGYRQVADPSVYVRFPLVADSYAKKLGLDETTSLLVWTTTPWTLPSNQFAAVHPDLEYALVTPLSLGEGGERSESGEGRLQAKGSWPDDSPEHAPQSVSVGDPPSPQPSPSGRGSHAATPLPTAEGGERSESGEGPRATRYLVAAALVETLAGKFKCELRVERTFRGSELVGLRYVPPFDGYRGRGDGQGTAISGTSKHLQWRVVHADFVTTDSGTGVVHLAPAFGEVDFDVLVQQQADFDTNKGPRPELINAVAPDGTFTDEGPDYCRGRWVKDCDKDISRDLKHRGLLVLQEQYLHDYPFCWRADQDPLIQYPRRSWFIKTSQYKDAMLANNARINWLPEHIKDGRFGNFLATNVDWALSRERYWGTPLPVWVCEQTGRMEAIANYDELLAKPGVRGTEVWESAKRAEPNLSDDLKVHKPYIDAIAYDSPFASGARMKRVTEVIDCWFDSGAMPFAQWGYQGEMSGPVYDKFRSQFPADFISEAIDQTRGWFYSQLAISTLLFGPSAERVASDVADVPYPHPFKNCIVLGLMLGEDGQKMSKSKRNYREPGEIFDKYGADALRWYFYANQEPWTGVRYSEQAIKDSIPEFLLRLWNVYSFFVIYANIDGFDPLATLASDLGSLDAAVLSRATTYRPIAERGELDVWIISELHAAVREVVRQMEDYRNFQACAAITKFVDALSNWYVRRSRDRFWAEDKNAVNKLDAYWTLYECLLTTTKLVAPFVPFLAESLWQNLAVAGSEGRAVTSVHLADYPWADATRIDAELSREMEIVREIISQGRNARTVAKLKVRQPLTKVEIILVDPAVEHWLADHAALIREELNVKQVEFAARADQYVTYTVLPDLKRLGPRLGKELNAVKQALAQTDAARLLRELQAQGHCDLPLKSGSVRLEAADVQVRLQAKPGWAAAQGPSAVVVLATELTPELLDEGWARELIHIIQAGRKDLKLDYTDRIVVTLSPDTADMQRIITEFGPTIAREVLAGQLEVSATAGSAAWSQTIDINGHEQMVTIERLS